MGPGGHLGVRRRGDGAVSAVSVLAQIGRLIAFGAYALREMLVANVQVAWDAVTPRWRLEPGVVELPLRCRTPLEITTLANLITLTPGTLTLSVTREPPTLYVHGMYAGDPVEFRAQLRAMETRVLHALRREGFADDAAQQDEEVTR